MKKFLLLCFVVVFASVVSSSYAQDRTITGTVTSVEDGSTLPGVNVLLKGTSNGTVTDINGLYRLTVPADGGTLVFSFIGLRTIEVDINSQTTLDVSMQSDVTQLQEVVVTALDIERDKKTLGYATQEVTDDNLRVARQTNLNEALAGKIAGVQVISGSGAKFGQAAVRIRGVRGFNSADPLYVVDGLIVSDPAAINMDNVASVNVLKGANASALYGSRARDGVIIITTKKAEEGALTIDFNNTTLFDKVSVLPEYQNEYGGGYSQDFTTFEYMPGVDDPGLAGLDGALIPEFYADESWGPRLDGRQVAQWDAFTKGTDGYGQTRPWSPNPDNVNDFFETGVSMTNGLSIGKAAENYNVHSTITQISRSGVLPGSSQDRIFLNLNAGVDLSDKVKMVTMANYNSTQTTGNLFEGYNSIASNVNQWFQRQLDMDLLKKYYRMPDGRYTSWNMNSARNTRPLYWNNPYTDMYANFSEESREYFAGKFGLSYEIIDGLSVSAYLNRFYESSFRESRVASGTLDQDSYSERAYSSTEDNYQFQAQYDKTFDKWSVNALVGGNIRKNRTEETEIATSGGLSVPDLYNISASIDPVNADNEKTRRRVNSVFASASFGYNGIIFIDATVRRDWDSALPADNNAFTYPSVSASLIFSEFLNNQSVLSFGKVRASYAEVGGELNPYSLNPTFSLGTPYNDGTSSYPTMGYPNDVTDAGLKAATTSAIEAGAELGFLNNRLTVDFSYYTYDNTDEITTVDVPATVGVSEFTINAGKSTTKGWDAAIGGTPIRTNDFDWTINFNIAQSKNEIKEIYPGIDALILANGWRGTGTTGGWGGISARAKIGEEWGTIVGDAFVRNDAGELVVDADGYATYESNQVLGTILPDFTGGIFNRFTYKNLELSFTIDWQKGGAINSITNMFVTYSGLSAETVGNNDLGNPMRDPVSEGGGLSFGGVHEDGTPNTTYLSADEYWKSMFALHERWVYDASYVKLREVRLGYNLPQSLLMKTGFLKRASIAFVSNNTWLIKTNVPGIDPSEISGDAEQSRNNGSWVDSGQLPSTRTIGFDIRLGF